MKNAITICTDKKINYQMLYFTCSSLSSDDRYLFGLTDFTGHWNIFVKDLTCGKMKIISDNKNDVMKSYVYFDGTPQKGLSKASVTLDSKNRIVYYIQDNQIMSANIKGEKRNLLTLPNTVVTAFMHVSSDGKYLCIPTTDARALDYDPETEGTGLDRRPVYNIDKRIQEECLSYCILVLNIETGKLEYSVEIPKAWVTHVQFHPQNPSLILYNNEWPNSDCGVRRLNLLNNGKTERLRTISSTRSASDWVCHEMWSPDGQNIIYHGAYTSGQAFVGKINLSSRLTTEIPIDPAFKSYGHFTTTQTEKLICDGYFHFPNETLPIREEDSTENSPDPHKKNAKYICIAIPDWKEKTLKWNPICKHDTTWLGQDTHPHPINNRKGDYIYFTAQRNKTLKIFAINTAKDINS